MQDTSLLQIALLIHYRKRLYWGSAKFQQSNKLKVP